MYACVVCFSRSVGIRPLCPSVSSLSVRACPVCFSRRRLAAPCSLFCFADSQCTWPVALPSAQCLICRCLSHPACVGLDDARLTSFVCAVSPAPAAPSPSCLVPTRWLFAPGWHRNGDLYLLRKYTQLSEESRF